MTHPGVKSSYTDYAGCMRRSRRKHTTEARRTSAPHTLTDAMGGNVGSPPQCGTRLCRMKAFHGFEIFYRIVAVQRPKLIVYLYGLWLGWVSVLLLARSKVVHFSFSEPPLGIVNYCSLRGYPKEQDYFWYALMLISAPLAIWATSFLRNQLVKLGTRGKLDGLGILGAVICAAIGTLLVFTASFGFGFWSLTLVACGVFLPWFDRDWFVDEAVDERDETGFDGLFPSFWWLAVFILVATVWCFDTCLSARPIDGYHEGNQLLTIQSYLAGDRPGIDFRCMYGPLYTYSIAWWMKLAGMTMYSQRWYFMIVQILGTALHLWALRLVCRSYLSLGVGIFLMLTLTMASAIGFGSANSLRTAMPMVVLCLCWWGLETGNRRPMLASAVLAAISLLYSHEYALAGMAACGVIFAGVALRDGFSRILSPLLNWGGLFAVSFVCLLTAMYRWDTMKAIGAIPSQNYGLVHLAGHQVWPMQPFPWFVSAHDIFVDASNLVHVTALWLPGLLCVVVATWASSRRTQALAPKPLLLCAIAAYTLLAQLPVLARPLVEHARAAAMFVLLLACFLDQFQVKDRRRRLWFYAGLGMSVIFAVMLFFPSSYAYYVKYKCDITARHSVPKNLERIGNLIMWVDYKGLNRAVKIVRELCPPGERIYVGAPFYSHIPFLVDRAGLPPFLTTYLAATKKERGAMLRSLEEFMPPVALITEAGIDIPYAREHPEEWAYIQKHYVLYEQIDDLQIFKRVASRPLR